MLRKDSKQNKPEVITVFMTILAVTVSMLFFVSCGKEKGEKAPGSGSYETGTAETEDSSIPEELPAKTAPAGFTGAGEDSEDSGPEESTDIITGEDTAENDLSWAEAYHRHLVDFGRTFDGYEYSGPEYRSYDYIYVNDDDIPELVIQGQDEATGNIILTYKD